MHGDAIAIPLRLVVAMIAGGLIGPERSYSGRPAGLRTVPRLYSLEPPHARLHVSAGLAVSHSHRKGTRDPTRMARIMTGIGFLGAGPS